MLKPEEITNQTGKENDYRKFLNLLSDDEQIADEKFIFLRKKVIVYFECRKISPAEDFADEVLHRAVKKVGEGEEIENVNAYILGIARFVRLESYRIPQNSSLDQACEMGKSQRHLNAKNSVPASLIVSQKTDFADEDDLMKNCLNLCLKKLPEDKKKMLIAYYETGDDAKSQIELRKQLAQIHQKTMGALQKQICKLRQKVSLCSKECVKRGGN